MFDLGGHSLLAARILAEVRETFGVDLSLRSLFERPTIAELAQSVRDGLAAGIGLERPPIARVDRTQPLPLSLAQERQWILHQLAPGTATYNVPVAIRLQGPLDVPRLERVLNEIVSRHEILRSAFPAVAGNPVQDIRTELHLPLPVSSVPDGPEAARVSAALTIVGEESRRPFDLTRHPLIRARLLRLRDDDHALVLTMPHIVIDGWSVGVLFREMNAIGSALAEGRALQCPELPVQFADYAVWQRTWLTGPVLDAELAYWTDTLRGAPPRLTLPTDYPRPAVASFRGAFHAFEISATLVAALEELGRRQSSTFFMTALAAWATLLSRYSGQRDIVIGSFFSGRTRPEVAELIGFFVNTVALRIGVSGSFQELLGRVRDVVLGAYAHQDLPFEKVIEALDPERSLAHTPIFQVGINLIDVSLPTVDVPDLRLTSLRPEEDQMPGAAQLDLSLKMSRSVDGTVAASIVYDSTLFAPATIGRMAANLETLLMSAVSSPATDTAELELIAAGERREALSRRGAFAPPPESRSIHDAVTGGAARAADAVAVVGGGESWSYRELERRSRQISGYLADCGIGSGDHVAVMMRRTPWMIAAVLGVLKSGAACVPLDASHPTERLRAIVSDSRASAVIVDATTAGRLRDVRELDVDGEAERIAALPDVTVQPAIDPRQAAFVIYTSGSTGTSKGVVLEHRSLLNYFEAAIEAYRIEPTDRVLQFSSIAFDASLEEIFPCLMCGATLVLRSEAMAQSPARFFEGCEEERISVLGLPTAYWHELVEYLEATGQSVGPDLRLLVLGGERVLSSKAWRWQQCVASSVDVVNTYGPAEASVVATACSLPRLEIVNGSVSEVPIGRPVRNVRAYVLDGHMAPVPIGVAGELYLGGAGLARGYLARPDLTADRFVPDPYGEQPGERLYRTGDICRFRSDGQLEYLGRSDHQVKIRGFRVELGEIEAVLAGHATVRQAAVIAPEEPDGRGRRLVAYVAVADAAIRQEDLQAYLAQKLPGYMVPSVFVLALALPSTVGGKVDRQALRPLRTIDATIDYEAPRSALEASLAAIWADVLGVERVGLQDNFFALGGHSLLITRLVYKVAQQYHVEVPYRRIFEGPTLAEMAAAVEEALLDDIEQLTDEQVEQQLARGE
jgi:amino acid adenylation domain-containing protein